MLRGDRSGTSAPKADLLLVNGRILTMAGQVARALAAKGDRVLAVGEDQQLAPLRGPKTRLVDLRGRLALPGFTDCHVHLRALGRALSEVRLDGARFLADALRQVKARARRSGAGRWITGGGFDKNRWGDAFPTRHDLDGVAPEHPVALHSRDGHSLWVNSLALRKCGITRKTEAPCGGVILRDAAGEPTGILQERAAGLIYDSPEFEARGGREDLVAGLRALLRRGVTSAHAMEESGSFDGLQRLEEAGRLPVRVTIYRHVGALDSLIESGVRSGLGDEWLRIGGIKLLVDGSLGSQTAWMFEPYEQTDSFCGVPVLFGDELREVVRRASEAGLACAIHAIGDRANAEALDALEAAGRPCQLSPPALCHRVEHAQLLRPRDIPRFARLGVVASMQPCHILGDIELAQRHWGPRSRWAYPIRSLMRVGASVIFGSDAPVETADPMAGIYAAVRRQTRDGRPQGGWHREEEGIGRLAALRAYTLTPARATGERGLKGALVPGSLADIVVLSEDVTRLAASQLLRPRLDLVFVGGRLRHRRRPLQAI